MRQLMIVVFILSLLLTGGGRSAAQDDQPALRERVVFPKPTNTVITDGMRADLFVLKWHEGTRIRLRDGQFVFDPNTLTPADLKLLQRFKLTEDMIKNDLSQVNALFTQGALREAVPMFSRPEAELEKEKAEGEQNSGEELADLNLYSYLFPTQPDKQTTAALIDQVNALSTVEIAYPEAISRPASVDLPPTTSDYTAGQGYLSRAPTGIDARYAWNLPGGRGNDTRIIDIEFGWTLEHEDLPTAFFNGRVSDQQSIVQPTDIEHGTAVIGQLVGDENSYGVTGIVPQAQIGVSSVARRSIAAAITDATARLRRGDIILIEQQACSDRIPMNQGCRINRNDDFGYIAVERWQAEFDSISQATALGIIVVEAAGNGSQDFDSAIYGGLFNRTVRDSRAIIVGAGISTNRATHPWSNAGSRVDVQGWGDSVTTLGYGDLAMVDGPDVRQWYTASFAGTSSASPMVAGAAAALQGIRKTRGLPVLNSIDMRRLLRETGTCRVMQPNGTWSPEGDICRVMQPDGTWMPERRPIGPLPNLRRAIDAMLSPAADRFERNDDLGSATTMARGTWVHTQSFLSPPRQVIDTWTMRLPDLTLSSINDRDFFRIPIPDPANPAEGGYAGLQECEIIAGSGFLSELSTERRGELHIRVIPEASAPVGEGLLLYRDGVRDDGLGVGSLLEQTITCPRTNRGLRELTFSFGERRAGERIPGLRYRLLLEYRIISTNHIPPWLVMVENVDISLLLCPGPFPLCGGDPLDDPANFVTRHPYGVPECLEGACDELRYFVWPGGEFDVTFVADVDLTFQLFDESQVLRGEAQLEPPRAQVVTNAIQSEPIAKRLKLGQLAPGLYVLRVDGPTAEYSVSFVPPPEPSGAKAIYLPIVVR